MTDYPIFLLPKGEVMITAKIEEQELKLLKKTLFPSGKRYAISNNGLAACIDCEKKIILYGQINDNGDFDYIKIVAFPSIISPKSLLIIKNNIVFGGENNHEFFNNIKSHELLVSYSISNDKFIVVDMPFKGYNKCVDDLLIDNNNNVIAVDDEVYPKYLIEYDFSNPDYPYLRKSYSLPENGTYERINKGTLNENYIALLSSTFGMDGGGRYINIFIKGFYDNYIRLSQWCGITYGNENSNKEYFWRDIYLLPNHNILLISSDEDGIGIYRIENEFMKQQDNEDSDSVYYFNSWGKKVIKILPVPNDKETVILVFEEGEKEYIKYSYEISRIEDIISKITVDDNICDDNDFCDDRYDSERNDWKRDYFDAMTDGQMGDYDDFDGSIDDIDTWSRG
ncbi:MAG: hypothetical protein RBR97_20910 [Bacteroidales bacterium]|nr:hypothetical protein [Bacteroidales bacterium]